MTKQTWEKENNNTGFQQISELISGNKNDDSILYSKMFKCIIDKENRPYYCF